MKVYNGTLKEYFLDVFNLKGKRIGSFSLVGEAIHFITPITENVMASYGEVNKPSIKSNLKRKKK